MNSADNTGLVGRMSVLDRFIPVWILGMMAAGVGAGYVFPGIADALDVLRLDTVSLPIAIGLLWMMYPVLTRVRYEELGRIAGAWKVFGVSVVLNWVVGPALMFALAWLMLPDKPDYREGLIIVGLARCIAMVLLWNFLAGGDEAYCAVLVALNSVFQMLLYSVLAYFYIGVASSWVGGGEAGAVQVSMWDIARSVLVFLGIPLAAGVVTRYWVIHAKGRRWFDERFVPALGPTAMAGLLFTVFVMFSMKGDQIVRLPLDVLRIAAPLLAYFVLMFGVAFAVSWRLRFGYAVTATQAFTAASNNFELAIAVAVATYGIGSAQAMATVVGPLIEVPVLLGLVYVASWARRVLFHPDGTPGRAWASRPPAAGESR